MEGLAAGRGNGRNGESIRNFANSSFQTYPKLSKKAPISNKQDKAWVELYFNIELAIDSLRGLLKRRLTSRAGLRFS